MTVIVAFVMLCLGLILVSTAQPESEFAEWLITLAPFGIFCGVVIAGEMLRGGRLGAGGPSETMSDVERARTEHGSRTHLMNPLSWSSRIWFECARDVLLYLAGFAVIIGLGALLVVWIEPESKVVAGALALAPMVVLYVVASVRGRRYDARMRAERGPCTWEAFEQEFAGSGYPREAVRAAYEYMAPYVDFAIRRSDDLWKTLNLDDEDLFWDLEERCAKLGCSDFSAYHEFTTSSTVDGYVSLLARVMQDYPPKIACDPSSSTDAVRPS
ncbi:MAG: hypothetical protein HZA52_09695 [Planctomycetes bacterium]|nr:hypothetical protein [Planctomycetota bacterium]